jgi:hypothetical protein
VDYLDDIPSISLTGVIPDAHGDIYTPPCGRAVLVSDLRNLDARRRFGAFGRILVDSERRRRSPPRYRAEWATLDESSTSVESDREGTWRSTRRFGRIYNVSFSEDVCSR